MQDWRIQVELHHVDCIVYADRLGIDVDTRGGFFVPTRALTRKGYDDG